MQEPSTPIRVNTPSTVMAPTIARCLADLGVEYDIVVRDHGLSLTAAAQELELSPPSIARALVLQDQHYLCMVVLPLDRLLDFAEIRALTQHNLGFYSHAQLNSDNLFTDCDAGVIPPAGELYNLETFYDVSLFATPSVYFEAGSRHTLVRLIQADFQRFIGTAQRGCFAVAPVRLQQALSGASNDNVVDRQQLLASCRNLCPTSTNADAAVQLVPVPDLPAAVRRLSVSPQSPLPHEHELIATIDADEALATEMLFYAQSPLFGSVIDVMDTSTAVSKVYGLEFATDFAFGLSLWKLLDITPDGPLGRNPLKLHGIMCATLLARLHRDIQASGLNVSRLCLAGLVHNLGYALHAHAAPARHFVLNKLIAANPQVALRTLETSIVGEPDGHRETTLHNEIAAQQMQAWGLPNEIVIAARYHHDPDYAGEHCLFANLIYLANALLKEYGLGDADSIDLPKSLLDRYQLNSGKIRQLAHRLIVTCRPWLGAKLHGFNLELFRE